MNSRSPSRRVPVAALVALMSTALAAGCTASAEPAAASLTISEPTANAAVSVPFTVQFASSVPLGGTETGQHHVHLYFDDNVNDYLIVTSTTVQVTNAPPGQHVMHLSLRNANHSPAGTETQVAVTIGGTAASPSAPAGSSPSAPTPTPAGGGGYDY